MTAFPRFVPPPVPPLDLRKPRPVELAPVELAADLDAPDPAPETAACELPLARPRPDFPRPRIGRTTLGAA